MLPTAKNLAAHRRQHSGFMAVLLCHSRLCSIPSCGDLALKPDPTHSWWTALTAAHRRYVLRIRHGALHEHLASSCNEFQSGQPLRCGRHDRPWASPGLSVSENLHILHHSQPSYELTGAMRLGERKGERRVGNIFTEKLQIGLLA